jgi:hypothetical protein
MFLSKHYPVEVHCVADVWEEYTASILSLGSHYRSGHKFWQAVSHTHSRVDTLRMEIFHNSVFTVFIGPDHSGLLPLLRWSACLYNPTTYLLCSDPADRSSKFLCNIGYSPTGTWDQHPIMDISIAKRWHCYMSNNYRLKCGSMKNSPQFSRKSEVTETQCSPLKSPSN